MAIAKRGNSFQVSIVLGGERYRRSFKTYNEAEVWQDESKLRHKKGLPVLTGKEEKIQEEVNNITWGELSREVFNQRWKFQKSAKTHQINLNSVLAVIGEDKKIKDTTQKDVDKLGIELEKDGAGTGTLNRKYSTLSVLMRYAVKRGYMNKIFEITKYKEPEHRVRWLSDEEEKKLLEYFTVHNRQVRDIIKILMDTGLRLSELWRLTANDVSDTHLTVWISKGGKPRTIPLTKRARDTFYTYIKGKKKEDLIFEGWTNWRLTHYWNKGRENLGLEKDSQFVPHILRHTFCTRLIQRGIPITHVQRLAGHSDITTTLKYSHLSQEDLDRAITVLERSENVSQTVS